MAYCTHFNNIFPQNSEPFLSETKSALNPFFELARLSEVAPALRRLYNSLPSSAGGSAALPAGIFVTLRGRYQRV